MGTTYTAENAAKYVNAQKHYYKFQILYMAEKSTPFWKGQHSRFKCKITRYSQDPMADGSLPSKKQQNKPSGNVSGQ